MCRGLSRPQSRIKGRTMDFITKLFMKNREAKARQRECERAIFMAGVEEGRRIQRDIDTREGVITGRIPESLIDNQITRIIRKKGF